MIIIDVNYDLLLSKKMSRILSLSGFMVLVAAQDITYNVSDSYEREVPSGKCSAKVTVIGGKGGGTSASTGGTGGIASATFSVSEGLLYRAMVASGGGSRAGGGSSAFLLNNELLILGGGGGGGGGGLYGGDVGDGGNGDSTGKAGGCSNGTTTNSGINLGDGGDGGCFFNSRGMGGDGGEVGFYGFYGGTGGGGGILSSGGSSSGSGKEPTADGSLAIGGVCNSAGGGKGYTSGGCGNKDGGGGGGHSGGGGGGDMENVGGGGGGGNYINNASSRFISSTINSANNGTQVDGVIEITWYDCPIVYSNTVSSFVSSTSSDLINNTASASGETSNGQLSTNTTLSTPIQNINNLTLTKSSAVVNNTILYQIIVTNTGQTNISNVTISDDNIQFNQSLCSPPLPTVLTPTQSSVCQYNQTYP
jgi:hypothetical protein